jgi:hypothetical protein
MLSKTVFLGLTAMLLALTCAREAQAWGAYHAGYTHFGAGGVYHYGTTAVAGPYGAYGGYRAGGVGAYGGGYHYGYGGAAYGGYNSYYPNTYGGYAAGGYHYGYGGAYGAGVYRAW